jgi:hypothetical protein
MSAEFRKCRYRVDAWDRIIWVDEIWLAFARENGAAELTESAVLMRPLWDFVAGANLCRLFQNIHERVRTSVDSVVLPFRCDSPTLQRHMRLTITQEHGGQLLYDSMLIRTVPQRRSFVLDAKISRSAAILTICSSCKQALIEPIGWLTIDDASARLGLLEGQEVPQLRHTICPDCAETLAAAAVDSAN